MEQAIRQYMQMVELLSKDELLALISLNLNELGTLAQQSEKVTNHLKYEILLVELGKRR